MHPYVAAGTLIFISATTNIGVFHILLQLTGSIAVLCLLPLHYKDPLFLLELLQLTAKTIFFLCCFPVWLIVRCFGFRSQGVEQGSLASQYQSSHYGSTVPQGPESTHLQSSGVTMWIIPSILISLLSYVGVVIVLGREWEWWLQ
ncbi:hypothetical protein BD769DRAFT_221764 [Suillus cothurnatus]|nr:hypothetical protein BD769DRAFT_221764 [Suillus cothurnatus]